MKNRFDFVQFPLYCPICKRIYTRSKRYSSPYALKYHLNSHNTQDEIEASITINEVRQIARGIAEAIHSEMLSIKKMKRIK